MCQFDISLQSSHSCKLNTIAWVVGLTYLHAVVKCESLLGGHSNMYCNENIGEMKTKNPEKTVAAGKRTNTFTHPNSGN